MLQKQKFIEWYWNKKIQYKKETPQKAEFFQTLTMKYILCNRFSGKFVQIF